MIILLLVLFESKEKLDDHIVVCFVWHSCKDINWERNSNINEYNVSYLNAIVSIYIYIYKNIYAYRKRRMMIQFIVTLKCISYLVPVCGFNPRLNFVSNACKKKIKDIHYHSSIENDMLQLGLALKCHCSVIWI